jgi:hypothetical protein
MKNIPTIESDLLALISAGVEESASLDYKRADSLNKRDDKKKTEITKDVSSFANSAGGVIIYGIAEGSTADKRHRPDSLSPVDRNEHSKEWLDQICAGIRPPIDGLEINSVQLSSGQNDVAYVVVIPASTTAHQAADGRYYQRRNFLAEWMEDYQIRDVMNRRSHPVITLEGAIECDMRTPQGPMGMPASMYGDASPYPDHWLNIYAVNHGGAIAQMVVGTIKLPDWLVDEDESNRGCERAFDNHVPQPTGEYNQYTGVVRGNPQWMPILPNLSRPILEIHLPQKFHHWLREDFVIEWIAYCDTAPARTGQLKRSEIKLEMTEEYRRFEARQPHR